MSHDSSEMHGDFTGQPNIPYGEKPGQKPGPDAWDEDEGNVPRLIEDADGAPLPPGLQPGASKDNPRDATTAEIEYIASLRAQTRAAAQQEVALVAAETAHDQMGMYFEESRERLADVGEPLSIEERRRWHALACIAENGEIMYSTRQSMEAADKYARWLETGEIPPPSGP